MTDARLRDLERNAAHDPQARRQLSRERERLGLLTCGHTPGPIHLLCAQCRPEGTILESVGSYAACARCARGAPADPRSKGTV